MSYTLEALPGNATQLGEGPHWDIERQSLYYVDIYGGSIHRYDYKENKTYSCEVNEEGMVSFIIPVEGTQDRFAVGIERRVGIVQWDGVSNNCSVERVALEVETDPSKDKNRFNDGKADPRGRLFAGTMRLEILGEDIFEHREGSLYRYESCKPVQRVLSGIGISNGMAWNVAAKKMYYIDSLALNVTEYDYNVETGDISNPKVLIDFKIDGKRPNFVPDGMTIDKDGYLYVATYGASKILKINPKCGKIEREIEFPCEQITSCAFGGPNLDTLFVTTSKMGEKPAPAGTTYKVTGLGAVGLPMDKVKL